MESISAEKNLRVHVGRKLNISQQCALATVKVNHILGCISKTLASLSIELLFSSISVVRFHTTSYVQCWGSQYRREDGHLEHVKQRSTKTDNTVCGEAEGAELIYNGAS